MSKRRKAAPVVVTTSLAYANYLWMSLHAAAGRDFWARKAAQARP